MPVPSAPPERLRLREDAARAILLVHAIEEGDPDERLLDAPTRRRASAEAAGTPAEPDPDPAAFLTARATLLVADLARRFPFVRPLARAPRTVAFAALAAAAGFTLGAASNLLGPERRVHVLWNPVLFLVAWNLAVYVALALHVLRRPRTEPGALALRLAGLRERLATRLVRRAGSESRAVASALLRTAAERARATGPLAGARMRVALHSGALAAALGALGGTYLRGLVLEYRATWESTFLSAGAAERLLAILFAPARALTGIELAPLDSLRAPASAPAAPWIHLLAVTVLLLVVVPRALLALGAAAEVRRLARAVPLDVSAPYYRRLLAPARGAGVEVLVVPYAAAVAGRALDGLRARLAELHGARASVRVLPALEYGGGAADVALDGGARLAVVFGLQQTPEAEVHGRFLAELCARGERPLVVVDASRYRAQLAPLEESATRRLDERRRAWDAVARDAGCPVTHADLEEPAARADREAAAR